MGNGGTGFWQVLLHRCWSLSLCNAKLVDCSFNSLHHWVKWGYFCLNTRIVSLYLLSPAGKNQCRWSVVSSGSVPVLLVWWRPAAAPSWPQFLPPARRHVTPVSDHGLYTRSGSREVQKRSEGKHSLKSPDLLPHQGPRPAHAHYTHTKQDVLPCSIS